MLLLEHQSRAITCAHHSRLPSMLRSALRLRPASRALSSWAPSGGDRVLLRGLLFHAHHGVLPAERTLGQKFELDLALSVDLRAAGASDALEDTISYADVYECAPSSAGAAVTATALTHMRLPAACAQWCKARRGSLWRRWRSRWPPPCCATSPPQARWRCASSSRTSQCRARCTPSVRTPPAAARSGGGHCVLTQRRARRRGDLSLARGGRGSRLTPRCGLRSESHTQRRRDA